MSPTFARRNVSLPALLLDGPRYSAVEEVLPDGSSPWPITPELGRFLARLVVEDRRTNVLEFGAGRSSLVLAHALSVAGGGRLTSVEHEPRYCREIWREVEAVPNVACALLVGPLRLQLFRAGPLWAYAGVRRRLAAHGPYDLVFIDGPPGIYGRDASLHIAFDHLTPGALIVLDDATRPGEQTAIRRWQRIYRGLRVELFEPVFGRGLAVLQSGEARTKTFSFRSFLGAVHDRWLEIRRAIARPNRRQGCANGKSLSNRRWSE